MGRPGSNCASSAAQRAASPDIAQAAPNTFFDAVSMELTQPNVVAIDPFNSQRHIYRAVYNGQQREIWRPGDEDGDIGTDYFDRQGDPLPLEKRWRLFQSDIGPIKAGKNEPPKFVFLDDRAAWEVISSDIARSHLSAYWPHDFGGSGKLRARRPHCGRDAVRDPTAHGDAKYHSVPTGKQNTYHFVGDKNYIPVRYQIPPKPTPQKRKLPSPESYNPRAHGHNQFTPRDQLVKHGAPSFSQKPPKDRRTTRTGIAGFLGRTPSPPWHAEARRRAANRLRSASSSSTSFAMIDPAQKEGDRGDGGMTRGKWGRKSGTPPAGPFVEEDEEMESDARDPVMSVLPAQREGISDPLPLAPADKVGRPWQANDGSITNPDERRVMPSVQEQEILDLKKALAESRKEAMRWKGKFERLAAGL